MQLKSLLNGNVRCSKRRLYVNYVIELSDDVVVINIFHISVITCQVKV